MLRQGESAVDEKDVASALAGRIARFKLPHNIFVVDGLPKNANGKTQRSALMKLLVG